MKATFKALAPLRISGRDIAEGEEFDPSGFGDMTGEQWAGMHARGRIEIVTGAASVGQGIETSLAQICAEVIPAPLEDFTVIHGQTDRIAEGRGAFASRVTVMTGSAVHICAQKLREEILAVTGRLLQSAPDELAIADGRIAPKGDDAGPSVTLGEVANAGAGEGAALSVEDKFLCDHMTYPYGIHGAVVTIDQETGEVAVERLLVAYDIGRAVNSVLVEGQIAGGAAQGIGGALFEEFVYDETGQPLAATFADYLIPTSREMPGVETLIVENAPSPLNPLGVKGAGEGGINAVGAVIASAIDDALGKPGAVKRLPVTPRDIRRLMNS